MKGGIATKTTYLVQITSTHVFDNEEEARLFIYNKGADASFEGDMSSYHLEVNMIKEDPKNKPERGD